MKRVGLVGWRGMVGSVLMQRMQEENDLKLIEPVFFTTSQAGQAAPDFGVDTPVLHMLTTLKPLKPWILLSHAKAATILIVCLGRCVAQGGKVIG